MMQIHGQVQNLVRRRSLSKPNNHTKNKGADPQLVLMVVLFITPISSFSGHKNQKANIEGRENNEGCASDGDDMDPLQNKLDITHIVTSYSKEKNKSKWR